MYWIALSLFIALVSIEVVDWRRIRQLLPIGLAGLVLAGIQIGLPDHMLGLHLTDTGPVSNTTAITLLLQTVGGPIFAMWFAQGTTAGRPPVLRVLRFVAMDLTLEWQALAAGRIIFAPFWHMGWSALWYTVWYLVVWWFWAYLLNAPARAAHGPDAGGR